MSTINILGKPYHIAERTTIRQDRALELALQAAGTFDKAPNETEEQLFARVFSMIIDNGTWAQILACKFIPVGEKWSPELQALTAFALEQVDDPDEKDALAKMLPWVIASFFVKGMLSENTSRAYSTAAEEGVPNNETVTLEIRLGSGARWFMRLRDSIRAGWMAFWIVLSTKRAPVSSKS